MELNEYQRKAIATDKYTDLRDCVLGMVGEAGEVANKVSKVYRDKKTLSEYREAIALELGDTLWGIAAIADRIGYSLDEIAVMNNNKLADRYSRGMIGGEGDYR